MNMVEKVAKALCEFDTGKDWSWENHKCQAEVAIAAMREPTEEMVKAGADGDDDYFEDFSNGYKRMIDAALKQEDGE